MRQPSSTENPVVAGRRGLQTDWEASAPSDALHLRTEARETLERLAEVALQVLRRRPGGLWSMEPALAEASHQLETYCAYVSREIDTALEGRGGYAMALSAHLHGFGARQRCTLRQLAEQILRAPHSAGVAYGVLAATVVLLADLDSHGRDMALIVQERGRDAA